MPSSPTILVVAATARELASADDWTGITCGVGPVEAAVATARAIAEYRPAAVLHVGIAGARRARALSAGTLVVGTHACYADLGDVPPEWALQEIPPPAWLLEAVRAQLPHAVFAPIGTTARVGGIADAPWRAARRAVEVEAMEGFAVLRAAQQAGLPAIEVRAISNDIEETDRARWHFAHAFATITEVTPRLVQVLRDALTGVASRA